MKFVAFQMLKDLFSSSGHTSTTEEEPGLSGYLPCEIDSLRSEVRANNALAAEVAATRGYKRNPRAMQLT